MSSVNRRMKGGSGVQNPPRHPSKAGVEKLSLLNVEPSKCVSLSVRLELRLERLGFSEVGGWGRKPKMSVSERLLEREGPSRSKGWDIINGVALGLVGSGGVESELSDSSDSALLEDDE